MVCPVPACGQKFSSLKAYGDHILSHCQVRRNTKGNMEEDTRELNSKKYYSAQRDLKDFDIKNYASRTALSSVGLRFALLCFN